MMSLFGELVFSGSVLQKKIWKNVGEFLDMSTFVGLFKAGVSFFVLCKQLYDFK